MAKVCIDAGHFGKYNRSPVNGAYYESVQMWKLHGYLATALQRCGIAVVKTRTSMDKDLALTSRGRLAKGCDLFVSLHSNAATTASVDYPVAIVMLDGSSTDIGMRLANVVRSRMGTKQTARTMTKKGSTGGEYYGVLRGAKAVGVPGVILEHSFHTNLQAANWLMNDANLRALAEAEAECIAAYLGAGKMPYTVKVEREDLHIRTKASAFSASKGYIKPGVYTIVEEENGFGRLKSGAGWIALRYAKKI